MGDRKVAKKRTAKSMATKGTVVKGKGRVKVVTPSQAQLKRLLNEKQVLIAGQ